MKKLIFLFLAILAIAVGLIVFGSYKKTLISLADENEIKPLFDFKQNTHSDKKPNRIVSLAPNLTEILFELGLDEKIVAVSGDSDYPPAAADKKKVGTFWQPNTEAIIASRPDLVITLWFEQQKAVADTLRRRGFEVLTLKTEQIDELCEAIEKIGIATGSQTRGDELVQSIRHRLDYLQSKLSSTEKVKVLWIVQTEPLRVAGRNTFVSKLLELAGAENAIGPTLQQYPPISSEELFACGAEIIIQSAMGKTDLAEQQRAADIFWKKYPHIPAVKSSRVYVVDSDLVLRLGPRLPKGIEMIARCLHPDIFRK